MSDRITGGDVVAAVLEAAGVRAAFGVISIHNMPILDALMRRGVVRCVAARGEAGATNMADAYARQGNTRTRDVPGLPDLIMARRRRVCRP